MKINFSFVRKIQTIHFGVVDDTETDVQKIRKNEKLEFPYADPYTVEANRSKRVYNGKGTLREAKTNYYSVLYWKIIQQGKYPWEDRQ